MASTVQLETIKEHPEIQRLIRDNEFIAQLEPWSVVEIHQAVDVLVGIDLDLRDSSLFGDLLAHFNQDSCPALPDTFDRESARDRARRCWGLEA
ncbi:MULTISPECIES: hypothetical protein [unclassified Halomonas]|uniref:hypothetical protein n=1 Tax=unclassified Halomonas TaxID=2609666 RepID=UPI00054F2B78|nr:MULTISPECIES: hypothetical protein [unclassified Halomonas]CEP35313.1 Putative uncharacterized protein [Halomonas sp. R57-5]